MFSTLLLAATVLATEPDDAKNYFAVKVVDDETGRGVPLVELRHSWASRFPFQK